MKPIYYFSQLPLWLQYYVLIAATVLTILLLLGAVVSVWGYLEIRKYDKIETEGQLKKNTHA